MGDARDWDDKTSFPYDASPRVGDIAQTDDGDSDGLVEGQRHPNGSIERDYGHVARVIAVTPSKVTVEQYNLGLKGTFSTNTYPWSRFRNYIHVGASAAPGLSFIKTKITGSGKVELFPIPGPNYQSAPTVATPTWFSPADANNGWFKVDGK